MSRKAARKDKRAGETSRVAFPDQAVQAGELSGPARAAPAPEIVLRASPRLRPFLAIFATQLVFLGIIKALAMLGSPPLELTGLDSIAIPSGDAVLGALFDRQGTPPSKADFLGAKVEFFDAPGTAVGPERTSLAIQTAVGPDGLAWASLKAPSSPGSYRFRARAAELEHFRASPAEAELLLEVVPDDKPLFFVLVPDALFGDGGVEPLTGAKEALQALSREWAIVYVATRECDSPVRLRAWLAGHGVPVGPVLMTRAASPGGTLRDLLQNLHLSSWKSRMWGISAAGKDASALAFAGVRSVLLCTVAGLEVDERTVYHAHDWNEARKKLEGSR